MRLPKLKNYLLRALSKVDTPQTPSDLLRRSSFADEYKSKKVGVASIRIALRTLEKNGFVDRIDVDMFGSSYSFWRIAGIGRDYLENVIEGGSRLC